MKVLAATTTDVDADTDTDTDADADADADTDANANADADDGETGIAPSGKKTLSPFRQFNLDEDPGQTFETKLTRAS